MAGPQRSSFAEVERDDVPHHHRLGGQHRLPPHHGLRQHDILNHRNCEGNLSKLHIQIQ